MEPCGEDDAVATGFMTSPTEALLGEITRGGVSASVCSFLVQRRKISRASSAGRTLNTPQIEQAMRTVCRGVGEDRECF